LLECFPAAKSLWQAGADKYIYRTNMRGQIKTKHVQSIKHFFHIEKFSSKENFVEIFQVYAYSICSNVILLWKQKIILFFF
jgi:hypothetical protein